MATLAREDALLLGRIADGLSVPSGQQIAQTSRLVRLVRSIAPGDVVLIRRHEGLRARAEQLRQRARKTQFPGGLPSLALRLLPRRRRHAQRQATQMRDEADACTDEAKEQWLVLSQAGLVDLDLQLCARCPDGSYLQTTEAGRQAVRDLVYSPQFEATQVDEAALARRIRLTLDMRGQMLTARFETDPRLDLAAAIISRHCTDTDRLRRLNRLASAQRWVNYDRLPLMALLCGLEGEPEEIWERFWEAYETARARDYAGSYETRLAVAILLGQGPVDDSACDRLWQIAKRLRLDGWSMSQATDPVAAGLAALRLSPTRIAARVQQLNSELERGAMLAGPFLGLATCVAASSNLHPQAVRDASAGLMEQVSVFDEFAERYDKAIGYLVLGGQQEPSARSGRALGVLPDMPASVQVIAATLALMPGTVQGNWGRLGRTTQALEDAGIAGNGIPLSLLLMDAAYPRWFDATRLIWPIGCIMEIQEPTSMFTAYGRMSPMYQRAAQAAEGGKPPGPGDRV